MRIELIVALGLLIGTPALADGPKSLLDRHAQSLDIVPPTISACGGGSPTITGTDNAFLVTAGTGALASCVINFGTTWNVAPNACVLFPANTAAAAVGTAAAYVSAISTTQLTITGTVLTGAAYYGHCF